MHIIHGQPGDAEYKITCYADPTRMSAWLGLSVTAVAQFRTRHTRTVDRVLPQEHLLFCQAGGGRLQTCGRAYDLQPGQLAWMPANQPHSYEAGPDGWWIWALHVTGERVDGFIELLRLTPEQPLLRLHQTADVLRLWTELVHLLQHRPTGALFMAGAVAQQLFIALRVASVGPQDERMRFLAMVDIDSRNLDKIALTHGLSKGHFIRRFREVVGVTPWQHVIRLRLDRAKELLAEPDLPIAAIAAAVGFDDPNYFSRLFSRHVGLSPRRFRETLQL